MFLLKTVFILKLKQNPAYFDFFKQVKTRSDEQVQEKSFPGKWKIKKYL